MRHDKARSQSYKTNFVYNLLRVPFFIFLYYDIIFNIHIPRHTLKVVLGAKLSAKLMELDPKLAPKVSFIWPRKQGKSINKKGNNTVFVKLFN